MTAFLFTSCNKASGLGPDADYFMGIKMLEEGKTAEAKTKFVNCEKKGTYYCARKSAIALSKLGNVQEKNKACLYLLEKYPDPETRLLTVKQLASADETALLLELTDNLPFEPENNAVIKIRIETLNKRGDSRYLDEVARWFLSQKISTEHYQFYRDTYYTEKDEADYTVLDKILGYRMLIHKRNYLEAYEKADSLFELFADKSIEPEPELASDLGKAFLYGNDKFSNSALFFQKKAKEYEGTCMEYYFWFYAGRLFDLAGLYYTQAIKSYEQAIAVADTDLKKDNALWYLLKTKTNLSFEDTISQIGDYAKMWTDASYFDDFFDKLFPTLIVSGNWDSFTKLYDELDGYASDEIMSQLAYLIGRFIQEGYIVSDDPETAARDAFLRAIKSGTNSYYKMLAAYKLGLSGSALKSVLTSPVTPLKMEDGTDRKAADSLLRGYIIFGYPEQVYEEWQDIGFENVSLETAVYISKFLKKYAEVEDSSYYSKALRIASRAASRTTRTLNIDELELLYPRNFSEIVDTNCKKYDIKESVIYALIRSESFFDSEIVSNAGAIGLTQLMETTGSDIARRLKKADYSLTNPQDNIEFGIYYLATLNARCDNSLLQAFFSYNAGITRVRRWLSSSMAEYGKKENMSGDLFLETIPYTETREYGRKLITASVMYEWIYSGASEQIFYEMLDNLIYK